MALKDENWEKLISYDQKRKREEQQIFQMYQDIFQDPEEFATYYFHFLYPKNRVLKLEKDSHLAAMVHLNPYQLCWGTEEFDASYIVAVATDSSFRRQGMMAALLKKAFSDLSKEGQPFTYLIPANPAYYSPFDFAYVMDWESVQFESKEDDSYEEKNVTSCFLEKITPSLYEEAASWLNQMRKERFDLWVKADAAYIKQQDAEMRSEGGGLYFLCRNGERIGYFACTMDETDISCTNVWKPEEISAEELGFYLARSFQKERISLVFPGNEKKEKTKKTPKIMVRILCLTRFLSCFCGKKSDRFVFRVNDNILTDNQGCFSWQVGPDGSSVTKVDEKPEWEVSIQILTKILFGYGDWEDALSECTEHGKEFFRNLNQLTRFSITEEV